MKTLRIAPKLELPLDYATETGAVLGRRGSGKTHTASVIAEELLGAHVQLIVIDPLDAWHGLRSSADGKSEGFSIVVFGGTHGDLPLSGTVGARLADVIVERRISAVLSLRHLSKGEARRFVGEFAERIYDRKGEIQHREPLHVFVDEADAFVPQRVFPDGARAHGAIDTLVRRGRSSGIGTTLISQRAAVVSKDVLTQTEVLVCHQTTGPQDRKALDAWIEANDPDGRRTEFLGSLASLKRGEAWFWSPARLGIFQRVQVRPRKTFDSSSTPKVGEMRIAPQKLAPVDLDALRDWLSADEEEDAVGAQTLALANEWEAIADDLVVRLAEVERERDALRAELATTKVAEPTTKVVDRLVEVLTEAQVHRLEKAVEGMHKTGIAAVEAARDVMAALPAGVEVRSFDPKYAHPETAHAPKAATRQGNWREAFSPEPDAETTKPAKPSTTLQKRQPDRENVNHAPRRATSTPPEGWTMEEEALYQKFKARLLEEAPALVKVLSTAPELEVTIARKVVDIDGSSMKGRIGRLIADGFLDSGKRNGELVKELGRTGPTAHPARVSEALSDLIAMRIVTREGGDRYAKSPGAKVTTKTIEAT